MQDYSLLRGPCPEGFHVPTSNERSGLINIASGLNVTTGASWEYVFHFPIAGCRDVYGSIYQQGANARYRSSNSYNEYDNDYYFLAFNSSSGISINFNSGCSGYSIRPFKDEYIEPTSSWTVIDGTLGSAGIFWDQTNGVISITDGTTGYTIADKNLGATTVYNRGDTLSETNCGGYFQRGNNYMFPFTGTVRVSGQDVRVEGYGPGNYYYSSIFISDSEGRQTNPNDDLRGYTSFINQPIDNDIYIGEGPGVSDNKGPCLNGFHIPTRDEHILLYNMYTTMLGTGGPNFMTYLHIPNMGYRAPNSGDVSGAGTRGYYWTCQISSYSGTNDNNAYYIAFATNNTIPPSNGESGRTTTYGFPIRPFKNTSVIPDSSWTILYDGSATATGAGIYRDQINGLISISSDGINRITISDKNLGATQVWNYGDTMTESNCGGFFQRGNNYMFPFSGDITTSSTRVNAKNYGPKNYYSSSTFITNNNFSWDTYKNRNLWGGDTIGAGYDHLEFYVGEPQYIKDYSLIQGPCQDGFHIPTKDDFQILINYVGQAEYTNRREQCYLMPAARYTYVATGGGMISTSGFRYWTCQKHDSNQKQARYLSVAGGGQGSFFYGEFRNYALPIRPISNTYVEPDSSRTLLDGTAGGNKWVYHNSTLGLISIRNINNYITIADKNLGATAVYSGGTVNASTGGNFYQRGNNYGFPWTNYSRSGVSGTVYTLNNGPHNRYSSSEYKYGLTQLDDRASPTNNNLWGYESFINNYLPNVAEIYVGESIVRSNYVNITPSAGIYWNPNKKCISISSDGINRSTISDRDLGATVPGGQGLLYQRGNNYGFRSTGSINDSTTKVNPNGYGPGNYYLSNKFIINSDRRTTAGIINRDLWGGYTGTNEAMQGPCGQGWHIPLKSERDSVISKYNTLVQDPDTLWETLKMGSGDFRLYSEGTHYCCIYRRRCSNGPNDVNDEAYTISDPSNASPVTDIRGIAYGHPIRPFRNEPVIPNDTSRIKLA